ncbi:MAG: class I SAM-dependent methyltransferase [Cyclobacteriaceae bacterium]|nr:class I SAM-dependent methyltransferase [Cyclobacteriaceae bacterium]
MSVYTTEIASDKIASDNPIHQRLLQAYYLAKEYIHGDVLEIGCGEGRGISLLSPEAKNYTALDKIQEVIDELSKQYPEIKFIQSNIPPMSELESNSYDVVISFQVIEHIKKDKEYLQEIHRVLKPGGKAIITTPNIKKTLSRNPWHIREYTAEQLTKLAKEIFDKVEMKGVAGNKKVMEYYEMNKKSVHKITRFDIFNLQYLLPAFILKVPYDLLNRINRNKLQTTDNELVKSITHTDYELSDNGDESLDLFCVMEK